MKSQKKPVKTTKIKLKKSSNTQTRLYQVTGEIEPLISAIEAEKVKAGRFILATNILDTKAVSNSQVLSEYKAQQSNERGFRFIKDPLFFTASVFVKKPERIEAIGMIMGLCMKRV
ncbi:IS1634 family transposase [Microcoleus sp. K4-B3]